MNRYLLGLSLSVCPAVLYALGLGDIHLQSALNEPLKAEIDLVAATPEELQSLKAGLASRETFTRYGIDLSSQLNNLRFDVTRDRAGRDVLRVTSTQAMNDPFLTFLVEVSWARGRLLREYTLLLDPPVYMPGGQTADAPVAAPQTRTETSRSGTVQRTETQTRTQPQTPAPSQPQTAAAASAPVAGDASSYTVRRNDTLWQIASQYTSGSPRDINRMMVALYRANPEAFNRNINELRAGAILRVPSGEELAGIGASEAVSEVRRQYSEWREAQGMAAPGTESESARLKLVTPSEPGEGAGAAGVGDAATNDRIRALEAELAEQRRLLELKNAELARLQQSLGGAAPAQAPTEAEVPAEAEAPAPVEGEAPDAQAPEQSGEAQPAETPPASEPAESVPAPVAPAEEGAPSLLDKLIEHWMFVVAALLLLGGLIFAFLRRREEPDYEELGRLADAAEEPAMDDVRDDAATTARLRTLKKEENFLVEESGEHPQLEEPVRKPVTVPAADLDEPARAPQHKTADDTLSSETAINLDQGDPLAEADFHMAYGLYDQAADLVRIASEREPHRRDLQLKLLEIYFVWGNKDAFLQTAGELYKTSAEAPAGEWDKIAIMGRQIAPDDPMFAGAASSGAAASGVDLDLAGGETRMDLEVFSGDHDNIDLDFGDEAAAPSTESTAEMPDLKGSSGIDFVFDEPPKDTSATTREMAAQTMETPTIETPAYGEGSEAPTVESPALRDKGSSTIREKIDAAQFRRGVVNPDQTAELAIDDLGLDVDAMGGGEAESLDAMDETDHSIDPLEATDHPSDAATMLAGMDERSRRVMEEAEQRRKADEDATRIRPEEPGISATGTWILDEDQIATMTSPDVGNDATAHMPSPQARPKGGADTESTAELKKISGDDMDLDLDSLEQALASDTARQPVRGASPEERFSSDVFSAHKDFTDTDIDLDVSEARRSHDKDQAPTERLSAADMDLPELEPVTMSEVGTKLDLARAYMDMGDPEGARNILDEVLSEGTPTQKQEAQRLLDSLPG